MHYIYSLNENCEKSMSSSHITEKKMKKINIDSSYEIYPITLNKPYVSLF